MASLLLTLLATHLESAPAVESGVDSGLEVVQNRVREMFMVLAKESSSPRACAEVFAELTDLNGEEVAALAPFLNHRDPQLRAEAVFARIINDSEEGEHFALEVLRGTETGSPALVAAMRGLAWKKSPRGRIEAVRRLQTAEGSLLLEIFDFLEIDPRDDDIPYLIKVLERKLGGRAEGKAIALLREMTGYRMANNVESWRYWYRYHKATGTPFYREARPEESEEWTITYFGIPIYGKDVVFVLDTSGSMSAPMEERGPGSRGEIAIREIDELLPRLPADGSFGLVSFAGEVRCLSSSMLAKSTAGLARASQWMGSRSFGGGTNLHAGLLRALEFDAAEEIILLSDGDPSVGVRNTDEIVLAVSNANRWRNLRISAVGVGVSSRQRRFLNQLTTRNDGDLVLLR